MKKKNHWRNAKIDHGSFEDELHSIISMICSGLHCEEETAMVIACRDSPHLNNQSIVGALRKGAVTLVRSKLKDILWEYEQRREKKTGVKTAELIASRVFRSKVTT
jgi:hypothetical protein